MRKNTYSDDNDGHIYSKHDLTILIEEDGSNHTIIIIDNSNSYRAGRAP